jgi:hypothetical protein
MGADGDLCLTDFAGSDVAAALHLAGAAAFDLHQVEHAPTATADLGPALEMFADRLHSWAPIIRRELGLEHFVHGGVSAVLSRHGVGERSDLIIDTEALGSPRFGFVYTFGATSTDLTGGRLRLLDQRDSDATWHEFEPVDDQLVVFAADRHSEVGTTHGPDGSHRLSITGFVTGAGIHDTPDLDWPVRHRLQQHLLPRITEHGYEVRPIPEPVHELLVGMLELRRGRAKTEPSHPLTRPTGDADYVDLQDLTGDILRWLQPVHEQFAGMPLTPSNTYGIRVYRNGNTLAMHLDRSEALIVSSVLQIAQDVEEPWPLVIERDGHHDEVVLQPGQMLLYEGATCSHGRPTPLDGRSYANLFVHYRPVDWAWDAREVARVGVTEGLIDVFGRPTSRLAGPLDA